MKHEQGRLYEWPKNMGKKCRTLITERIMGDYVSTQMAISH